MPKIVIKIDKGVSFDKELCELAGCKINRIDNNGCEKSKIRFVPEPVIWADSDMLLAHEICHLLAGKEDYDLFISSTKGNECDLFYHVLNVLFDEYHESLYGHRSDVLYRHLNSHHKLMRHRPMGIPVLDDLYKRFIDSVPGKKMNISVKKTSDLITVADHIYKKVLPKQMADRNLVKSNVLGLMNWMSLMGGGYTRHERSHYYHNGE